MNPLTLQAVGLPCKSRKRSLETSLRSRRLLCFCDLCVDRSSKVTFHVCFEWVSSEPSLSSAKPPLRPLGTESPGVKHGTSSQLSLQNRMHTPVLYNKRAHLPTPRTPPELPGTWTPQFVLPSMQNPRVCFLFGGNGPSCSVLGLHQMVSEALSNTLPAPPTHTHLLGRKMARWSSVQIVPLPLHSLTPPLLPLAAPAGFSPHPSNS